MKSSNQNTLFNIALVALASQVGSKEAIELFFKTLDEKVESKQAVAIIESLFAEANLPTGAYEESELSFQNESELKSALATKLDIIIKQPRIV